MRDRLKFFQFRPARIRNRQPLAGAQSQQGGVRDAGSISGHLIANGVDLRVKKATMGAFLTMDPETERFAGNDKANQLLTRDYRKPFVVPEKV
jgi:hypothetical protein